MAPAVPDHPHDSHHSNDPNASGNGSGEPSFAILSKRNCSISPRAVGWLFAITVALSFAIGVGFAWIGLWVVLPFAGIEMLALGLAFYLNGRHAADHERIELDGNRVLLEIRDGDRIEQHRFHPHWVRVVVHDVRRDIEVALVQSGRTVRIGRHLDRSGRTRLAQTLEARFAGLRTRHQE